MENINLVDTFAEFKELKNIDRPTMMSVLEDVFRATLIKLYGSDDNFDIIINIDKGDFEIWHNREVVEELIRWGRWYLDKTRVNGFRMDAVKHIDFNFFNAESAFGIIFPKVFSSTHSI